MSSIYHKCNSSVVKHMLANPKVRGSILTQAELSFFGPARIYMSFYTEIKRENTSSKHKRYMKNGANRISSLTRV